MKIFKLPTLADASTNGEYRLGPDEAGTGSAYLVYGRLRPGETGHRTVLDEGHEEIICVIKGTMEVRCGKKSFTVSTGEAFNPAVCNELTMDNTGDGEAIYISARSCGKGAAEDKAVKTAKAAPPPEPPAPEPEPAQPAHEEEPAETEFEITNDGVRLED